MSSAQSIKQRIQDSLTEEAIAVVSTRIVLRSLPYTSYGRLAQKRANDLLPDFRRALSQVVDIQNKRDQNARREQIDLALTSLEISIQVADEIDQHEPYYAARAAESAARASLNAPLKEVALSVADATNFASSAKLASEAARISRAISETLFGCVEEDIQAIQSTSIGTC